MTYLDITVIDVDSKTVALTGDDTKFIKYFSDAQASMELIGDVANGDFCVIKNGETKEFALSATFDNIESNEFTFSCQGASGNSYSETVDVDMVDYVKLTCNIDNAVIDGNGKIRVKCSGNSFNGSFGKVKNTISVFCAYKEKGTSSSSDWISMDVATFSGGGYIANADIEGLTYDKEYIFEFVVSDKLMSISTINEITSLPIFHWGKEDFAFEVPVTAPSIRLEKRETDYGVGSYLRFGDGDNCYIAEKSDDTMTISATNDIHLTTNNGNVYINDDIILNGHWTPSLLSGAISGYSKRRGWYSKIGQVVSVGFYIKATCYSGYDDTQIEINGLPYTPSYSASGGGMCSRAYVSGDCTFQCFVAETDGTITTRVQSFSETDNNLYTSAGSCNYRSGGGEITLSGTITYTTNE